MPDAISHTPDPSRAHAQPAAARRIVITGIGWVTPLGHDIDGVWARILAGESGVSATEHFDATTFPTAFSAQVRGFDWRDFVKDPALHEGIGRNIAFALGAAAQAWRHAGLDALDAAGGLDHQRMGLYLGSGEGVLDFDNYVAANLAGWDAEGGRTDSVKWAAAASKLMHADAEIEQEPNMPLSHLAMEFGAQGPAYNCLTACAASTQAIGEAARIIAHGDADIMITGGTHTMIHPFGVTGFNRLTALSTNNADPTGASRPFSQDRDGFVMGEGSGILIIESADHAAARGAHVLAEIVGYGSTADSYRITDIHPDGRGAADAMRQALDMAGITPDKINYISAHGTGTKENDSIETKAVKAVFCPEGAKDGQGRFRGPPMSSIKGMTGHLIAAAGAVELITAVLAMRDQVLPPTINLTKPAPELDLDYVPNQSRPAKVDFAMSNNFGFGGQNDTLIIKRV